MTPLRYVGMSKAYTKGLATELNAESQTPATIENFMKEADSLSVSSN